MGVDSDYTLDIIEYVVDYYTTRMTSKYLELSDADAAAATEQHDRHEDTAAVEDLEQEEQNLQEKKNLPEHVQITKKVNLVWHSASCDLDIAMSWELFAELYLFYMSWKSLRNEMITKE